MHKILLKYDLQFFAEEGGEEIDEGTENNETDLSGVDVEAFADLISERDKRIADLENEMKILQKNNADLLVKMSAGTKPDKSIEETILDVCDTRKIK